MLALKLIGLLLDGVIEGVHGLIRWLVFWPLGTWIKEAAADPLVRRAVPARLATGGRVLTRRIVFLR